MEVQVEQLAAKAWNRFQTLDASRRYLIALVGIPGSGKTTAAASIVQHINQHHHNALQKQSITFTVHRTASQPDIAMSIPMDGFHLTRAQLSAMPDPEEVHYRRGAAFTFDSSAYLNLVTQLRQPLEATTRTITAPSFSHHIKDPIPHDIHIPPTARILIVEGLYTALDAPTWRDAAALMDAIWFIDTPISLASSRIASRNFAAGLSPTFEAALERTEKNDMRNARDILASRLPADETIHSVEDEDWKSNVPDTTAAASKPDGKSATTWHTPHCHSQGSPNAEEGLDEESTVDSGESSGSEGADRPVMKPRMDSIAILAADGAGM